MGSIKTTSRVHRGWRAEIGGGDEITGRENEETGLDGRKVLGRCEKS